MWACNDLYGYGFCTFFRDTGRLRAIQGIFAAAFSPVSITYVTETYSPVKRMTAISFISTSFMLSGIIGQNLSEIIVGFQIGIWFISL